MINYLLKSGLLLLLFFAVYKVLLENEKMFRFNRAYLLGSLVFSFVIPLQLVAFGSFFPTKISFIQLDGIIIKTSKTVSENVDYNQVVEYVLMGIYTLIALLLIVRFVLNLLSFYKKIKQNENVLIDGEKLVLVKENILPHSFWNTIFISKTEFENNKIPSELISHEKAHLVQNHSLDIIFIEILQIVFWFNPLLTLYKKAIKLNHEFLADEAVNRQFKAIGDYQNLLLDIAVSKTNIALASNINYLITKKRLLMMTKKESPIKMVLKVFSVGIISSVALFLFSTKTVAQEISPSANKPNDYEKVADVTVKPEFPGGIVEFYKFVGQNYKIPAEAAKNKITVKVFMQFMVEKDGSLSEFTIVKDAGFGVGEEAIRVLKLSPKWTPGSKDGKPVRVMYSLPIMIQTDK